VAPAERPTHLVFAGRALPISGVPLAVGSAVPGADRSLQVPAGPGVSREHCRVVRRDGNAWLEDRSTYGTFVNDSPVRGAVALRVGDRVRLGNPGVTLELIQVLDEHGAPTS
jgi:pSer/pThr/pTyr-binding forkhead associated (FHA) protein